MILGIDTSSDQCAVALVSGDRTHSRAEPMERGHAEALMPMIAAVLAEAGADLVDVTRIAVCTGPGSFTGLRIGIAAARGLAMGCGVPAIGVTRFEALAAENPAPSIAVPGRGGVIYVQAFSGDGRPAGEPRIESGTAEDRLADPVVVARLAADRAPDVPPAPLYLRGANADPPRDAPPVILDP